VLSPCQEDDEGEAENEARKSLPILPILARCNGRVMKKIYRIELDDFDLGQVIDGLEIRAQAWEATAHYHRTGESPEGVSVEGCRDVEEAATLAGRYRRILEKISAQRERQHR
jgi:hypothetical protein